MHGRHPAITELPRSCAHDRSAAMTTLLLAEHDNKTLKDATAKALSAARALGADVHVLVAGKDCRAVADAAAKLGGVNKVLLADAAGYEHMLAEPTAALIYSLARDYDAIVAPATTTGKNIMPRVAALLDVMQISDIVKVIAPDTFERLIYAGNAVQTVRSKDKTKVITVRTSTFQATGAGGSAPIEQVTAAADPGLSTFVGEELSNRSAPSSPRLRSSFRGGAPCKVGKTSPNISSRSPINLGPPSAPRGPRLMPVMPPTTGRAARPARSWHRSFTSQSGLPARSNLSPV